MDVDVKDINKYQRDVTNKSERKAEKTQAKKNQVKFATLAMLHIHDRDKV